MALSGKILTKTFGRLVHFGARYVFHPRTKADCGPSFAEVREKRVRQLEIEMCKRKKRERERERESDFLLSQSARSVDTFGW